MSIPMSATCAACFLPKRMEMIRKYADPDKAFPLTKELLRAFADAPMDMDSATLGGICDSRIREGCGITEDLYATEKTRSNQFVMERLDAIEALVRKEPDPVYAGLQFATLGNYLDFAALYGKVSFDALEQMLLDATGMDLDKGSYEQFCRDLEKGKTLLYIADNAGELVFDRLFAEILAEKYPHLEITFLVRGENVANDATRQDALDIGLPFPVLDNGTAIGGTSLDRISREARAAFHSADVILAKGMGNTESLFGCGQNVYYAFLVKCQHFADFFNAPLMKPLFIKDN